jgi:hypothetical protein
LTGKEASDLVEAALNQAIQSNTDHEDGDLLLDWVLIAYVSNPDAEKRSGYPMLFSNGDMPTYRARGLLTTALMNLEVPEED